MESRILLVSTSTYAPANGHVLAFLLCAAVAVLSWRSHPAMLSAFSPHHLPDMDAKRRIVGLSITWINKAMASTLTYSYIQSLHHIILLDSRCYYIKIDI